MDNSNEYIRMCLLADKYLRPLYKFKRGDYIFSPTDDFKPKVLSDYGIIIAHDRYMDYTIAFPKSIGEATICSEEDLITPMVTHIDKVDFRRIPELRWIRLHRQDQLQQLIKSENENTWGLVSRFYHWMNGSMSKYRILSMEQLWLAFVMENKFNRLWDGKFWEKIE